MRKGVGALCRLKDLLKAVPRPWTTGARRSGAGGQGHWLSLGSTQRKGLLGSSVPKNANDFPATASPLLGQMPDEKETGCVGRIGERESGSRREGGEKRPALVLTSGIWHLLAFECHQFLSR